MTDYKKGGFVPKPKVNVKSKVDEINGAFVVTGTVEAFYPPTEVVNGRVEFKKISLPNRPANMQMIKFQYKGKWYSGLYSECKDRMVRTNCPAMNMTPFCDVEQWEVII